MNEIMANRACSCLLPASLLERLPVGRNASTTDCHPSYLALPLIVGRLERIFMLWQNTDWKLIFFRQVKLQSQTCMSSTIEGISVLLVGTNTDLIVWDKRHSLGSEFSCAHKGQYMRYGTSIPELYQKTPNKENHTSKSFTTCASLQPKTQPSCTFAKLARTRQT